MNLDGKALSRRIYDDIKAGVAALGYAPHLTIFTCAPNFETQKYLALKKRKASEVGIAINVIEFPDDISTDEMVQTVRHAQNLTDGIVVQLPLPPHIDTEAVINAVPPRLDIDGMHYDGTSATVLPPVVGAIDALCREYDLLLATQQVVVVGHGRLVGVPAAIWAQKQGAHVTVLTKETSDEERASVIKHADVLILGTGQAGLITPAMVKPGVTVFDAGTSEAGGELRGDADPGVAAVASYFTPVPGGIGPLTVACLLQNLLAAARRAS